jgi:hypothetical protein
MFMSVCGVMRASVRAHALSASSKRHAEQSVSPLLIDQVQKVPILSYLPFSQKGTRRKSAMVINDIPLPQCLTFFNALARSGHLILF